SPALIGVPVLSSPTPRYSLS
ncbi:hypothetical protein A2U01_0035234, partial [Trifolium medium]|nr:hypothetical protein [Trifolium medium]